MSTHRAGLRLLQASRQTAFRTSFRQPLLRRNATTAADATATDAAAKPTGFQAFWNSPVGPKTVHFWAPIMKWGLVLAGAADFARPAEKLSITQNFALMCTGAIWTRWCFIIKPRNIFLAAVNAFLFVVGATQVTRIFIYNQSQKGKDTSEQIKDAANDGAAAVEGAAKDAVGAAKAAVGK